MSANATIAAHDVKFAILEWRMLERIFEFTAVAPPNVQLRFDALWPRWRERGFVARVQRW